MKENETSKNIRLIGPDFIKGTAIILMVYGHIAQIGSLSSFQDNIVDYIYTFHMSVFLIVSGYFFLPQKNPKLSIYKTFRNIFIPYVLFLSIYLFLLSFANAHGFPTTVNVGELSFATYLDIILMKSKGAYWFLHTLIVYQVLLSISYLFFPNKSISTIIFGFIFFVLVLKGFTDIGTSYANLSFLLIGYFMRINKIEFPDNIVAIIILVFIYYLYTPNEIKDNYTLNLIVIISIISILMYISNKLKDSFMVNSVVFIGQNTLIILLLHVYYINIFKLTKNLFLTIDESGLLYSIMAIVFTIFFSMLSAVLFDYFRISKYLFGLDHIYRPLNSVKK